MSDELNAAMNGAGATLAPAWLAAARAHADRAPLVPRVPFIVHGHEVGSVEFQVLDRIATGQLLERPHRLVLEDGAWHLHSTASDATSAMNALANAMREVGLNGPWRNEQLAVCNAQGERIGTIERGVVRPLGITTSAVHLIGMTPDGRMWVQQRAFNKANNPGM